MNRFSVFKFNICIWMALILLAAAVLIAPTNMRGYHFFVKAETPEILPLNSNNENKTNTNAIATPNAFEEYNSDTSGNICEYNSNASANQKGAYSYISEIKIASSYDSAEDALKKLRSWGCDNYLNQNLNEGGGSGYVYLGYKYTGDEKDAIRDIKMMDMNGGFKRMNYAETAEKSAESVMQAARELKLMCDDFAQKYTAGYVSALIAHEGLNHLKDSATASGTGRLLGDILANNPSLSTLFDILLMCNSSIVAGIYSYLTIAITDGTWWVDYDGVTIDLEEGATTWMERMQASDGEDFSLRAKELDAKATAMLSMVIEYANSGRAALQRFTTSNGKSLNAVKDIDKDEKLKELATSETYKDKMEDNDVLFMAAYQKLNEFKYGGKGIGDYLLTEGISSKHLYPLVAALTPAQCAAVNAGNFLTLISSSYTTNEDKTVISKMFTDTNAKLKDLNEKDKIPLWLGVNKDPYNGEVGVTQEAYRRMNAQKEYSSLVNPEADFTGEMITLVSNWVMLGLSITSLTLMGISGIASLAGGVCAAIFAKYSVLFIVGCIAAKITMLPLAAITGYAFLVVAALVLIYYLVDYLIEYFNERYPDYTEIPKKMYDITDNDFIMYDAVLDLGGKKPGTPADVNNFDGRLWQAIYTTKDPDAGKPLECGYYNAFGAIVGNSRTPDKKDIPIAFFGEKSAGNLNRNTFKDKVGGIKLYFHSEVEQEGVEKPVGKYISNVRMISLASETAVINKLEEEDYTVIYYNLTSGLKNATYIGYRTTDNSVDAITDIRVSYGQNTESLSLGASTYANVGNSGGVKNPPTSIEAGEYALYITTSASAGSPIQKLSVSSQIKPITGYEPVNLASGGNAFDFNTEHDELVETSNEWKDTSNARTYIHFLPTETYTSGTKYISGYQILTNVHKRYQEKWPTLPQKYDYVYHTFIDKMDAFRTSATIEEKYVDSGVFSSIEYYYKSTICYTETYNPKRAISNVVLLDADYWRFPMYKNIASRGYSYAVVPNLTYTENLYVTGNASPLYIDEIRSATPYNSYSQLAAKGMYVTYNSDDPLKVSDVTISSSYYDMTSVKKLGNLYDNARVNLYDDDNKMYMYLNRPNEKEPDYIKNITVTNVAMDDYAEPVSKVIAFSNGADEIVKDHDNYGIDYNLNRENTNHKAAHMGLVRQTTSENAITDIGLYYRIAGDPEAPNKLQKNGIEYTRSNKTPVDVGRGHEAYFYTTTSDLAGAPIGIVEFGKKPFGDSSSCDSGPILSSRVNGFFFVYLWKHTSNGNYFVSEIGVGVSDTDETYYNTATYNYVGEAYLANKYYAQINLLKNGFTRLASQGYEKEENFSSVTSGSRGYRYIGLKMTANKDEAITDIKAKYMNDKDAYGVINYNGLEYKKAGDYSSGNFNMTNKPIGLYYAKDKTKHAAHKIYEVQLKELPLNLLDVADTVTYFPPAAFPMMMTANLKGEPGFMGNNPEGSYVVCVRPGNNRVDYASAFSNPNTILLIILVVVFVVGTAIAIVVYNKKSKKMLKKL